MLIFTSLIYRMSSLLSYLTKMITNVSHILAAKHFVIIECEKVGRSGQET